MVSGYEDDAKPTQEKKRKQKKQAKKEHIVVPEAEPIPHSDPTLHLSDCYGTMAFIGMMLASNIVGKPVGDKATCANLSSVISAMADPHDVSRTDLRLGAAMHALAGLWHMVPEDW